MIGEVSGFDLRGFNSFRGRAPSDSVRLRDVKSVALSEPARSGPCVAPAAVSQ